jgi:uncharacterized membrane protein YphA (DoxX/SURF4 family)
MLNPFPSLLTYAFFAPALLRLGLVCVFGYVAVRTWRRAAHLSRVPLPLIGAQAWAPYAAAIAEAALGLMFLAGWYTQIAAILGILGMIKYAAYRVWRPEVMREYFPLSGSAALLVALVCLSLLLTGAGAWALDVPL